MCLSKCLSKLPWQSFRDYRRSVIIQKFIYHKLYPNYENNVPVITAAASLYPCVFIRKIIQTTKTMFPFLQPLSLAPSAPKMPTTTAPSPYKTRRPTRDDHLSYTEAYLHLPPLLYLALGGRRMKNSGKKAIRMM